MYIYWVAFYLTICVWQDIAKQALSVTKALAGNDNVKEAVVQNGGVQVILAAMTKHQANPRIAELGAATLAAIVLRNQGNSKKVMELNGHQTLLQAMKIHTQDANVQVSPTSLSLSLFLSLSPSLPVCFCFSLKLVLSVSRPSLSSSLSLSVSLLSLPLCFSLTVCLSLFFLSCNAFFEIFWGSDTRRKWEHGLCFMLLFPVPETVLYGHQKPGLAGAWVLWPIPGAGSGEFDSGGPAEPQVVSGRVKGRPQGPWLWSPPGGAMEGREAGAGSLKGGN